MFIKHPKDASLINTCYYADIRCCSVNVTHVDFYIKGMPAGKRGKPAVTVILDDEKERDAWFKSVTSQLTKGKK